MAAMLEQYRGAKDVVVESAQAGLFTFDPDAKIAKAVLHRVLSEWCRQVGRPVPSRREVMERLRAEAQRHGVALREAKVVLEYFNASDEGTRTKRTNGWRGIGLGAEGEALTVALTHATHTSEIVIAERAVTDIAAHEAADFGDSRDGEELDPDAPLIGVTWMDR